MSLQQLPPPPVIRDGNARLVHMLAPPHPALRVAPSAPLAQPRIAAPDPALRVAAPVAAAWPQAVPQRRRRARAWIVWAALAALFGNAASQSSAAGAVATVAGLYAAYLLLGGRDVTREARDGTRRSIAWLYWALITVGLIALASAEPAALLVALATGAYSTYLFRGGRWVLWIF